MLINIQRLQLSEFLLLIPNQAALDARVESGLCPSPAHAWGCFSLRSDISSAKCLISLMSEDSQVLMGRVAVKPARL